MGKKRERLLKKVIEKIIGEGLYFEIITEEDILNSINKVKELRKVGQPGWWNDTDY